MLAGPCGTGNVTERAVDETQSLLRTRFASEPIFLEVIDAMYNIDQGNVSMINVVPAIGCLATRLMMGVFGVLVMASPHVLDLG
jgi:hypothetical protein